MIDSSDKILQILDSYSTAVLEKNVQAFMQLYDEDARVFETWGVWSFENTNSRLPVIRAWLESLGSERVVVKFDGVRVTYSHDIAMVTALGTYAAISVDDVELRSMQNRFTWALRYAEGCWKIIHEHTSVPIADDLTAKLIRD